MLKEYRVLYALKSANGNIIHHAIVVRNLEEVTKTKRRIKEAGLGFLDVEWRERQKHFVPLDEGWQKF